MSKRILRPVGALVAISVAATLAHAQEGSGKGVGTSGGTHPCASIADATARLACYDATFGRPGQPKGGSPAAAAATDASSAAPVAAVGAASAAQGATHGAAPPVETTEAANAAAVEKARREFGLSEAGKRALEPAKPAEAHPDSISGKVASVSRQVGGELVVTLEDGQVWAETRTNPLLVVKPGEVVTIRKASLGSYMLVSAKRVATHVRRIK